MKIQIPVRILKAQTLFWKSHPALFISFGLLFGILAKVHSSPNLYIGGLILLTHPLLKWKNVLPLLLVLFGHYIGSHVTKPLALAPDRGVAYFIPLKPSSQYGHNYYKGVITQFESQGKTIPCKEYVKLPINPSNNFRANAHYYIPGSFVEKKGKLRFFPEKNIPWQSVKHTFSLVEIRYKAKELLKKTIHFHITFPLAASFIHSLLSGEVDNPLLTLQLNKLGLQHVLAVSGFHFGLVFLFLSYFARLFFRSKIKILFLLLGVSLFFLFVGDAPSVQRAWLSIFILLLGQMIASPAKGLNTLGIAFLVAITLNPAILFHMGFILSFAATFGILFFMPLCKTYLEKLKPTSTAEPSTTAYKLLRPLSSFFKEMCFLNIAVTITTLPILLCLFHRFPLLSLIYNLFFPTLISAIFFLVLIALICLLLCKPVAALLFSLVTMMTKGALYSVKEFPVCFDFVIRTKMVDVEIATLLLTAFLALGIYIRSEISSKKGLEEWIF